MNGKTFMTAIVIAAWNRPQSLKRLLDCLSRGSHPPDTTLHISIDHFEYDEVFLLAQNFEWQFGPKVVEFHPQRLGLRDHLLYCGSLSAQYGSIILLEDDLASSPFVYDYAQAALSYFGEDEGIAGISLYNYAVAESCHQPFQPWMDEWDNWFLQLPSSWGAAFTADQWQAFQNWLSKDAKPWPHLPEYIDHWPTQSWKKLFAAYLIATNKYFVYPRFSLTSNFEDFGTHAITRGLFQVPLLMGKREWNFGRIGQSLAVYDAHFEPLAENIKKLCPPLAAYEFTVDLLGQKDARFMDRPWVLTRKQGGETELSFGANAIPTELNLYLQSPGNQLRLVPASTQWAAPDPLALEFSYYNGVAKTAALHLPDRRMPSIAVIVHAGYDWNADSDALDFLFAQTYPGMELVFIVEPNNMHPAIWAAYREGHIQVVESSGTYFEGIQKAVAASSSQLILILDGEFNLMQGTLERIAKIFRQFPGLDWLSGLPNDMEGFTLSRQMAPYRWDTDRFRAASEAQITQFLPPALQVFRRALWASTSDQATTLPEQFRQMGLTALPQVSTLEFGAWEIPPIATEKSIWGDGKVNRTRGFYHHHIPLLWKWHRRLSDYRPVLRYDAEHDTWYEFAY